MNKIYNIVYSEERGTWVVCSELERASRKNLPVIPPPSCWLLLQ
ncbi:ESPR domain-containing protein [Eikenella corrodens]|nr:ESPR domain-containing protein [Eikenella corrodens]